MSDVKSFMQHLSSMPQEQRNILKDNVAELLRVHGTIPNPLGFDPDRLSRLAIGFLATAMTNFVAAHMTAAVFDDNGEFDVEYEHLLRNVIVPSLVTVGLLSTNEPDSENCIWATHICLKIMMANGWHVQIVPDDKEKKFYIRHVVGTEVGGIDPGGSFSYSEIRSSVVSIPFFLMSFRIKRPS